MKIPQVFTLIIFSLIFPAFPANGLNPQKLISQFTHKSWTNRDGIPGPVRAIVQTPDGYLWLGTEAGLYHFDGVRFVLWESDYGQKLPGSSVWSLLTASDGSLWIGFSSGGISRLFNNRLRNFTPEENVPSGGILSMAEDKSGAIWAGGEYGFSKFETGEWRRIGTSENFQSPGAQAILVDHQGTLWVATTGFNFGLSGDTVRKNTILSLAPEAKHFSGTGEAVGMIWKMAESPDGAVWIADTSGHSARQISKKNGSEIDIAAGAETMCLLFDTDRSLWLGMIEGGIRRVPDFTKPENIERDQFKSDDGLSSGMIYSTFKDREGNIWFGTAGGLERFRENKATPFSMREGLMQDQQIALTADKRGNIWFAGYTHDWVQRFYQDNFQISKLEPYSQTDSTRILSLYADGNDGVFIGGSFKLAQESGGKFSYIENTRIENGAMVEGIVKDAAGNLWITLTGIAGTPKILRFQNGELIDFSNSENLPKYRCRILYTDKAGRVWLGFENGEVAVYENDNFYIYSSKNGLPGGRILAITEDSAENIWVSGEGGLSRLHEGRFITLTKENGLPSNSVSAMIEDEDNFLWIAASLGIFRVNRQELDKATAENSYRMHGTIFDANDGLRGLPRQREPFPTATRANDGRLWFATTGGVAVIDPRRIPKNIVAPPVVIEALKADDRIFTLNSEIELPPNTRNLEFHYTALSLTEPEKNSFRYRLEGYDEDWREPVNTREVIYTNLSPGNYRFRVIASNNDGVWNEEGATLDFIILPAFYQTNWFLLMCTAAASFLVWMAYRRRVRQIANRLHLQFEERLSERTRIAQDLHDTLLQGVVSVSMQLDVAIDQLPENSPAKPRLDRLAGLIGQVVIEGRNTLRGLRSSGNQNPVNLEQRLSLIKQELDEREQFNFRVIVEGLPQKLHSVIGEEIYHICREALINAFRHSRGNIIEIEVEYAARQLRILVRDNGCGIDPNILRQGREGHWGLSGMRERAEKIGARLKVYSRAGGGTEVELSVPNRIAFGTSRSRVAFKRFNKLFSRQKESSEG